MNFLALCHGLAAFVCVLKLEVWPTNGEILHILNDDVLLLGCFTLGVHGAFGG